jgi:hypothetical protein
LWMMRWWWMMQLLLFHIVKDDYSNCEEFAL